MKNPWEYMSAERTPKQKKDEKKNKDESDDEDADGIREDDPRILRLIQVQWLMVALAVCMPLVLRNSPCNLIEKEM
jgi:hypothetical protein